jgi:hypothetical protein
VTYTRYRIDTIESPDDEHLNARNMQRIEINIHKKELCAKLVIKENYNLMHGQSNINISLTSTTWMNHLRLNVSYIFSSSTSRTSKKFGEYWTLLGPEILSYTCYLKINHIIMLPLVSCGSELDPSH